MNLQDISADVLRNDSFWLSILFNLFGILFLVLAFMAAAISGKWYRAKKIIPVVACIAIGVSLLASSGGEWGRWKEHNDDLLSTRTDEVHDWLQKEYEATASDDVAESIYRAMHQKDYTTPFLIEGPDGVIEVTIAATDDGEFHVMHNSAEVTSSK